MEDSQFFDDYFTHPETQQGSFQRPPFREGALERKGDIQHTREQGKLIAEADTLRMLSKEIDTTLQLYSLHRILIIQQERHRPLDGRRNWY